VLPKLLNYLAFQSFDLELPDENKYKTRQTNQKYQTEGKKTNMNAPFINLT
jgi:hypothetical protein